MTSYRNTLVAAGFAVAITVASSGISFAANKAASPDSFQLKGTIVDVERGSRTVVVKQDGTNASVRVHVPEGGSLQLSPISQAFAGRTSVGIELATRGQQVSTQVSGDAEPSMAK